MSHGRKKVKTERKKETDQAKEKVTDLISEEEAVDQPAETK